MIRPRPMPPMEKQQPRAVGARHASLRRIGEGKRAWHLLYVPWLAFLIALDPLCRRCRTRPATEGHHPFGQLGALILCVLPFCRPCHDHVHFKDSAQARADGWIRDLK